MRTLTGLLIAAALLIAACGDDDSTPVSAGAGDDTASTDTTGNPAGPTTTTAPPGTDEAAEPIDDQPEPVDEGSDVDQPSGEQLEAELAAARERWGALDAQSYRMRLSVVCFCLVDHVGPFDVTVTDATVTEVAYAPGALAEVDTPPADADIVTVEEIFDVIERSIGVADEVRVTYDAETGVPTEVWIDRSFQTADEEIGYTVALDGVG